MKLNARQLRTGAPDQSILTSIKKNPITIIVDNVLDTYNVGAIFRLADATSCEKVYLCGETLTPPNHRIKKASINTWEWVNWSYAATPLQAIAEYKRNNPKGKIVAIEQTGKSIPLFTYAPMFPIALVVGNESYGVSKEVLDVADEIVELPMYGINTSLNVMVCCGIVLYKCIEHLPNQ